MSTATRKGHWLADALREMPSGGRVYATGVSWDDYVWLSEYRTRLGRAGMRITFDHDEIELMTTSFPHEKPLDRLRDVVKVLCEELDRPCLPAGATTLRRADLLRGTDPDTCFYLANAPVVERMEQLDLSVFPPPDLAIEVDVSRSSLPRQPIYAALGVPELWRHDDGAITIYTLRTGEYAEVSASPAFPTVTSAALTRLLLEGANDLYVPFIRRVRQWARSLPTQP